MPAAFDDLWIGQVVSLGACVASEDDVKTFCANWAPDWPVDQGIPEAMIYAIWSQLEASASCDWPQTKRLAVDALRWMRTAPAGELLRGRLTIMGKDAVGETKGVIIAQNDLVDEAGRLVFSCLTRSIFQRNPPKEEQDAL